LQQPIRERDDTKQGVAFAASALVGSLELFARDEALRWREQQTRFTRDWAWGFHGRIMGLKNRQWPH
jgi:hypothetical protein